MEETRTFLITYCIALLGMIPPGIVNISVAKTCFKLGKKNGIYMAVGGSITVLVQAFIAILLAGYIFNNPYVKNILLRTGLVIFLIMMVYFLLKAGGKRKEVEIDTVSGANSFFKGMITAALNVFPIPFYVAIGAALNVDADFKDHFIKNMGFLLGAALGTFTTLYLYALFFTKIEAKGSFFVKHSNYFMAALMLILVIITLIRIFSE